MSWRSKKEETVKNKINSDEVEQLLQAAQDQLLLNLSLNSHIASAPASLSSNNYLGSDLDRRFQALKSSKPSVQTQIPSVDQELKDALGDDLSARFAALKAKNSSSTSSSAAKELAVGGDPTVYSTVQEEDDEVDQVEKLIQWAKDAARLDPSPPSDDDDDDSDDEGRETESGEKRK